MSTERSRPIEGYRQPQESDKDKPVDPKKFEEELTKVRESDASEKREKRNLTKGQLGEDDDEVDADAPLPSPGDAFTSFMSDSSDDDNALAVQDPSSAKTISAPKSSGKTINLGDSETPPSFGSSTPSTETPPPPPEDETPTYKGPLEAFPSQASTSYSTDQSETPTQGPTETPQTFRPQETTSSDSSQQDFSDESKYQTQQPEQTTSPEKKAQDQKAKEAQKKKKKDTSLISKQKPSFDAYLRRKKDKGMKDLVFDETPAPKQEKPAEKPLSKAEKAKKELEKQKAHLEKKKTPLPKEKLPSEKTTATHLEHVKRKEKTQKQKHIEQAEKKAKTPKAKKTKALATGDEKTTKTQTVSKKEEKDLKVSASAKAAKAREPLLKKTTDADSSSKDHDKDKKSKEEKAEQFAEPIQQAPIEGIPPAPAPTNEPTYSKLHPQIYELMEKMVGVMTIEQHKGVTTTTVTVSMKGSVLDGSEIVLEHYSTAPNAFNVQLAGSPEAQALFNENVTELAAAFASSKYAFDVNIKKPILLKEHRAFTRKEKVSREEDAREEKRRKRG